MVGPMGISIKTELIEYAEEELEHAEMLADRIVQLRGMPLLCPKAWYDKTNCGYAAPEDVSVKKLLEQNIRGEQCSIDTYSKILRFIKHKDAVTYNMITEILDDEVGHAGNFQNLMNDINSMSRYI